MNDGLAISLLIVAKYASTKPSFLPPFRPPTWMIYESYSGCSTKRKPEGNPKGYWSGSHVESQEWFQCELTRLQRKEDWDDRFESFQRTLSLP